MIEEEQPDDGNFFTERGELKDEEECKDTPYDLYDTDLGELQNMEVENERYLEFKVSKPTKTNGVIMYEVCGYDKEGDFKEMKRYSDFDKLRKMLVARWPGFNIPSIPQKKAMVSNSQNLTLITGKYGTRIYICKDASTQHLYPANCENELFPQQL